jgi:hypothetical protein
VANALTTYQVVKTGMRFCLVCKNDGDSRINMVSFDTGPFSMGQNPQLIILNAVTI